MKNKIAALAFIFFLVFTISSCATSPYRYNTQRGAAIGAGLGAITGQAIGRNTEGTLLGAGVGTLLGAIVGNAEDQSRQAARDARYNRRVVPHGDDEGPDTNFSPLNQRGNCR